MNTQDERKAFDNIQNEIQSWISVNSEHSCQLAGDVFVVSANELAEFVTNAFKKLEGCVVVPVEPTDAMCLKGYHSAKRFVPFPVIENIYKAMLEAARGGK